MKYFTSEWWANGCEDESVFENYEEYLASISSKLPPQLLVIQNEYTLHDANVKEIESEFGRSTITINLRGWDREFKEEMKYLLKFGGVSKFIQKLPQQEYVESAIMQLQ